MLRGIINKPRLINSNSLRFRTLSKNATLKKEEEKPTSSPSPSSSSSSTGTSNPEEIQSAIVDRMKQILEEKITTSSSISNIKQVDNLINQILSKYSNNYEQLNINQAKSYIKNEKILNYNKHAKDIYNSDPWIGKESNYDSNLRMIIDSKPKEKPIPINIKRKKPSNNEKLAIARDISLDYKINKKDNQDDDDGFREMYKERLLGPSMLMNNNLHSIDFVENLASNKINSVINQKTGKFKDKEMNKIRGKPLNKEHLKNCNDSNYFMNQILKNQNVKPIWIENQLSLDRNIEEFKFKINEIWFNWMIYNSELSNIIQNSKIIDNIENEFDKKIHKFALKTNLNNLLNESDLKYIETKIELINQEIRNYNLQCPSISSHKFKLSIDKEIKQGYERMLENFPTTINKWFEKNKTLKKSNHVLMEYQDKKRTGGFLNLLGNGDSSSISPREIHVNKDIDTKLHLWQAIKNVFK